MIQRKTYTVEEAKRSLERYCAYQDRCHKEVQEKLREMRMIPEVIDVIIHHLLEHQFLNETRFSQSFARGKFRNKHWGKQRIIRELKARNISEYNIKIALKEISSTAYIEAFHALAEKRWKQLSEESNIQRKRKKWADYLFYRGWESELVWDKLKELT